MNISNAKCGKGSQGSLEGSTIVLLTDEQQQYLQNKSYRRLSSVQRANETEIASCQCTKIVCLLWLLDTHFLAGNIIIGLQGEFIAAT